MEGQAELPLRLAAVVLGALQLAALAQPVVEDLVLRDGELDLALRVARVLRREVIERRLDLIVSRIEVETHQTVGGERVLARATV